MLKWRKVNGVDSIIQVNEVINIFKFFILFRGGFNGCMLTNVEMRAEVILKGDDSGLYIVTVLGSSLQMSNSC